MYSDILQCALLQQSTVHYIIEQHSIFKYITLNFSIVRYVAVQNVTAYFTVCKLYIILHYNTIEYNTVRYNAIQYNNILYVWLHVYTVVQILRRTAVIFGELTCDWSDTNTVFHMLNTTYLNNTVHYCSLLQRVYGNIIISQIKYCKRVELY